MYTVLFPNGNTLVFRVKSLAETYVLAYRGVIISGVVGNCNLGHNILTE